MVNKVILLGNLGTDPEIRYTSSGNEVATLRLATTRISKDREGNSVRETEWHRIIAWGRLAEYCKNKLMKGRRVYVEGRLRTRQYETGKGKRWITEIIAERILAAGPPPGQVMPEEVEPEEVGIPAEEEAETEFEIDSEEFGIEEEETKGKVKVKKERGKEKVKKNNIKGIRKEEEEEGEEDVPF